MTRAFSRGRASPGRASFSTCTSSTAAAGIDRAADAFRTLIDLGASRGGSYYLTYHRWARRDQVERCYPQMREFLALKRQYDPNERFQSTWYHHHLQLLGVE